MQESTNKTPLLASTAKVDITPEVGTHLAGGVGGFRPSSEVADRLYARALVVQSGEKKLCIISLDVCALTRPYCDRIRNAAVERYGFDFDAVMVHAVQVHTAPTLGHHLLHEEFPNIPEEYDWIKGGSTKYSEALAAQVIELIGQALQNMQPVQVGVGSGIEGRFAHSRRAVMRDGSAIMPWWNLWQDNPTGYRDMLYLEGPADPEVGVISFKSTSGEPVAVIVNHTCHPVCLYADPSLSMYISADWCGAVVENLQKSFGESVMPVVLNGACGDVNPWNPYDPEGMHDYKVMGKAIADVAVKVMEQMEYRDDVIIDWKTAHLKIPFREMDPEELASAQALISQHPQPLWADEEHTLIDPAWRRASAVCSIQMHRDLEGLFEYEIQIFRVGDTAFVGLPGEPFAEGGLKIKVASTAKQTYIVHMVNQYVGYIPTAEAMARGGHECYLEYWSKLAPEALDMIVAKSSQMLAEIFEA